ncbi:MAG: YegS/Rv2252/BmrU family lipid kinase [Fusobacteriaceae bacterium]
MKKIKFIYNPHSGGRLILEYLDELIYRFQQKGKAVVPYRIDTSKEIQDFFPEFPTDEYEYILISGGDGTINKVVNQVKKRGIDLPIAVLPTGTANDFGFALGLEGDVSKDLEKILDGKIHEIDLVKANERYFVNVLSSGLFTEVSQNTPTYLKNNIGKLAYYLSGILELPKVQDLKLTFEAEGFKYTGKCFMFFVFNGKTAGNINLSYKSKMDDGVFDVIIAAGGDMFKVMEFILKFLQGEHLDSSTSILHFKTSKLKISSQETHGTDVDGERGPDIPLYIECIPKGLKIIY